MQNSTRTVVSMKLDSEDYENIYLRVREKLWLFWASLIALFGGAGLVVLYFSMSAATEKAVNKYIQTEKFQTNVVQATAAKATELKQRTDAIEASLNTSERRVASLAKLPISIGENGITLMDQSGKKFFIESGTVKDGESIKFQSAFTTPPTVILNVTGDNFGLLSDRITTRRITSAYAPKVTDQGFSLRHATGAKTYNWVAIGQ